MKKKSIRDKLLKNFSLFSLIPVIIFCIVMLIYIASNVQGKRKDSVCSDLEHQATQLDKVLLQAYQIGQTVAEDEMVNQELAGSFKSERQRYESEIRLNSQLLGISRYFDENIKVYIVGENGGVYKNSPYSLEEKEYERKAWYEQIKESGEPSWFELHSKSYFVKTEEKEFISLGIPVSEEKTGRILGCVMVEIGVFDILHTAETQEEQGNLYLFYPDTNIKIIDGQVELYDNDRVTLIQKDGIAGHEQVEAEQPEILETAKFLTYWKKDFQEKGFGQVARFVTAYQQLNANDWILAYSMPKVEYYRLLISVLIVSVLVTVILILIAYSVSCRVSGSITRPILSLKEDVEKVQEGNFEIVVSCESEDEIGELAQQFNEMVTEIRNLMDRIQTEHERQRHYELLLLQAQINPHFLYNTLDSLMWLIRMENHADAEKMLEALTRFFKTGLNKGREIVSVKQEISNVESYLTIQLMRYKKKLSFSIAMDEEIRDFKVPKLILQPLVENAVYHGLKGKEQGGSIAVDCRKRDGVIVLCVSDDGLGMDEEQRKQIQKQLSEGIVEESESYGLTNVNERLKFFFGDSCTMSVESAQNEGTKVWIEIREEEVYVQNRDS